MKLFVLLLAFIVPVLPCVAQVGSKAAPERELHRLVTVIEDYGYGAATESASDSLMSALLEVGTRHPELMQRDFPQFDTTILNILTSSDRKLRIYCWDRYNGGTMHFYSAVLQYETAPGKTAAISLDDTGSMEDGSDPGSWYSMLETYNTRSGAPVYMAFYNGRGSQVDHTQGVRAFAIRNGRLQIDFPFFHTKTKNWGKIDYYYSLIETKEFTYDTLPSMELSKDKKTLTIPVVLEGGRMTKGKLTYRFDGEKFVFVKQSGR